ncbi:hypothetical protein ACI8AC_02330 [Geodermatophilus sp. SYSU D00758]
MSIADVDTWAIYGSLLVTGGSGLQAFLELRSFSPFAKDVVNTQQDIIDAALRESLKDVHIWQLYKRRRIRKATRKDGESLLNEAESHRLKELNRKAFGWALVTVGAGVLAYGELSVIWGGG